MIAKCGQKKYKHYYKQKKFDRFTTTKKNLNVTAYLSHFLSLLMFFRTKESILDPSSNILKFWQKNILEMTIESSELFGHHTECHRATGIEESVLLNFYNDQNENLVTVAVNILSVYAIRDGVFELLEEFELWGSVCSICKVRFQVSGLTVLSNIF